MFLELGAPVASAAASTGWKSEEGCEVEEGCEEIPGADSHWGSTLKRKSPLLKLISRFSVWRGARGALDLRTCACTHAHKVFPTERTCAPSPSSPARYPPSPPPPPPLAPPQVTPFVRNLAPTALFAFVGTFVSTFVVGGLVYLAGQSGR